MEYFHQEVTIRVRRTGVECGRIGEAGIWINVDMNIAARRPEVVVRQPGNRDRVQLRFTWPDPLDHGSNQRALPGSGVADERNEAGISPTRSGRALLQDALQPRPDVDLGLAAILVIRNAYPRTESIFSVQSLHVVSEGRRVQQIAREDVVHVADLLTHIVRPVRPSEPDIRLMVLTVSQARDMCRLVCRTTAATHYEIPEVCFAGT